MSGLEAIVGAGLAPYLALILSLDLDLARELPTDDHRVRHHRLGVPELEGALGAAVGELEGVQVDGAAEGVLGQMRIPEHPVARSGGIRSGVPGYPVTPSPCR